ncbi:aspartate/glutamate racemase family protein [Salmonella enterica]|uniref:Aspartate/glutamate racemase family protein n=1 Tax=Salmonella enterica TaxID=28901 RepID=A0A5U7I8N9_SALER|nr:aspartate/glutamate racemase family protein [Salmonella enterica]EGM2785682.1 aspartate/glutamate racemase family protein [Salmonella enterica]EHW6266919.1 aspartate/glutamate racemase family protein [Salmonella enterica]ELW8420791.1 aspartate/glutamate racemase family protein [Salmonella enterica]
MKHTIGILGGMGPAATADMLEKFVELRHASCDQQHIPLIVSSIPDIPDRTACLLSGGPSPYRYLERYLHMLEDAGAECIVIPCNTAHYWFDDLQNVAKARMISILDATLGDIPPSARYVGLLATNATLATGLYQKKALARGLTLIQPEEAGQALVMQAIYTLKRGDKTAAQALLLPQIDSLIARGAQAIIMGCTEIPLIVAGHERAIACPMIDSTASLVRAAIRWYESWPDTRASLTGEQRFTV